MIRFIVILQLRDLAARCRRSAYSGKRPFFRARLRLAALLHATNTLASFPDHPDEAGLNPMEGRTSLTPISVAAPVAT